MGQLGGDQAGHSGHRPQKFESWVREYVHTPSGHTGRRARWHEVFSQFNRENFYQHGNRNVSADPMSQYAYPTDVRRSRSYVL